MKKVLLALSIMALIVCITLVTNNKADTFTECDVYKSFENAKSVYGGYVPSYCE